MIPRLFDGRDKAFFFFNWESFFWPTQIARTRYLLNTSAQRGLFTYPAADGSGTKTIDVLALAASKGQASAADPVVGKLLADIRSAAGGFTAGAVSRWDFNNDKFDYSPAGDETRHTPALRVDFNLAQNHRVTVTGRYSRITASPDLLNNTEPKFPGFTNVGSRDTTRYLGQAALRSAFGATLVNEARVGYTGGRSQFSPEVGVSQFNCSGLGCQGGYNLLIASYPVGTVALTPATATVSPGVRDVPVFVAEDTLTWLKGTHAISAGASMTRVRFDNRGYPGGVVPGVILTLAPAAPAYRLHGWFRELPRRDQRRLCDLRQEPVRPPHRHGEPGQRDRGARRGRRVPVPREPAAERAHERNRGLHQRFVARAPQPDVDQRRALGAAVPLRAGFEQLGPAGPVERRLRDHR